ncbi:sigma-54-dependent Fis family transcriptional regulator [candidate division KSB1 bacterium]|nr:sigma-54-dependent Fis family transcriptional regulator [candidate division KSB1 bacterium]
MKINKKIEILLIEDEQFDVNRIHKTIRPFEDRLHICEVVSNGRVALELLEDKSNQFDVVIMDYQIVGGIMGENLIRQIKKIDSTLQIIVVTKMTINMSDFHFANALMEAGATWYCTKYPGDIENYIYQPTDFILSIFNAYEKKRLEEEKLQSNKKLQKNIETILANKQIIGQSPEIIKLRKQIELCAKSDTSILIQGASGTGKELVAANIHYLGHRKFESFVPVNCGGIPENLVESELFGFEKGSFTGANAKKPGLFEVANNGTIFLDEITELPIAAQSSLLRVIQEGEIDKIGRTQKVKVNVRIIAALNKDIQQEIKERRFREDLYYRLNVVPICVPPLNSRKEDIPLLVKHFIQKFDEDSANNIYQIDDAGMKTLINHDWRGNVRELQNVVQRLLFYKETQIGEEYVRMALGEQVNIDNQQQQLLKLGNKSQIRTWSEIEAKVRSEYFQFVRDNTESDAEAARALGLAPPNYHRMCKKLGLK